MGRRLCCVDDTMKNEKILVPISLHLPCVSPVHRLQEPYTERICGPSTGMMPRIHDTRSSWCASGKKYATCLPSRQQGGDIFSGASDALELSNFQLLYKSRPKRTGIQSLRSTDMDRTHPVEHVEGLTSAAVSPQENSPERAQPQTPVVLLTMTLLNRY
jgi:hypothetical protein